MVGEPEQHRRIVAEVGRLYDWIDSQLRQDPQGAGSCRACGACCDFAAYDHRLLVTPPELMYLAAKHDTRQLKRMTDGRCPYQQEGHCTVHEHRFAACRIFCCTGNPAVQSKLSETVVRYLKGVCDRFDIPYRYQDLATALDTFEPSKA